MAVLGWREAERSVTLGFHGPAYSPMNYLAHALLAGPDAADRVGGVVGDFVKGPLPAGLPADLAAGVELHRRIDSFANGHPAFHASRTRVSAARRRYAGVMIDLFYDHFLALHWGAYSEQPLQAFAAETYALIAARVDALPERFASMFPWMRGGDWLSSYREVGNVGIALDRMSQRRARRPNPLAGSATELRTDYEGFEEDFRAFFRDALAFAADFRTRRIGRMARGVV